MHCALRLCVFMGDNIIFTPFVCSMYNDTCVSSVGVSLMSCKIFTNKMKEKKAICKWLLTYSFFSFCAW